MSADVGGSWGVVTEPYVPPEQGPIFNLPRCGCVTFGDGAPTNGTGDSGDIYVDDLTKTIYQNENGTWVVIGSSDQQVYQFAGDPNGNVLTTTTKPSFCIDTSNHILWVKFDGVKSNTGWTSP